MPSNTKYDVVIVAVNHDYFLKLEKKEWKDILAKDGFFFDLKGILPRDLNIIRI